MFITYVRSPALGCSTFSVSATDIEVTVQRLKCSRPSFNHPGKVPDHTRARPGRFPASRSRFPGLHRFLDTSVSSILLPHPPTQMGVSRPHRCPRRSLPAVKPFCVLLTPGFLMPPLPRQHSRRHTRDRYLRRIRIIDVSIFALLLIF